MSIRKITKENPEKIYPGKSKQEILSELKVLYPPEKETLGVMAIEITPMN